VGSGQVQNLVEGLVGSWHWGYFTALLGSWFGKCKVPQLRLG
jgi:hypothetical protein